MNNGKLSYACESSDDDSDFKEHSERQLSPFRHRYVEVLYSHCASCRY